MENNELIQKYFLNELSNSEEQNLHELLKYDVDFKQEFIFQENLNKVIKAEERSKLKAKLNKFEEGIDKGNVSITRWNPWMVAASVVLLIAAGWVSYNTLFNTNYDNLYATNYRAYPNTVYAITRGDSVETLERKAFSAYDSGDYVYAINYFKDLTENNDLDYVDFYLAQAYLKSDSVQKSIVLFKKVIEKNGSFVAESNWYLALAYLKLNDKISATKHLEMTVAKYDYMKEEAKKLLEILD